jgi:hypothetical protein
MKKDEKDIWIEMSIREISTQANFAEISYSHIDPKAVNGNDAVFSSVHSFLSHCAMISKMLNANDSRNPLKSIGSILGILDSSIIHQRRFRNHLEHFDERMQRWIGKFAAGANIGTYNIGPKTAIQIPNMIFVSHYDPSNSTFTFVDEDFNLSILYEEAVRIKSLADNWVNKMQFGEIIPPYMK